MNVFCLARNFAMYNHGAGSEKWERWLVEYHERLAFAGRWLWQDAHVHIDYTTLTSFSATI